MRQKFFLIINIGLICMLIFSCSSNANSISDNSDYTEMAWDALIKENYDRAISLSTRAINNNWKTAESYLVRGMAYSDSGDLEKALQDLSKSASLEANVITFYQLAVVYWDLGNIIQARKNYIKAFSLLRSYTRNHTTDDLYRELDETIDDLMDIFWAWEWSGFDPVDNNISYTFIFMEDGTGNYTINRSGGQTEGPMQFKWGEGQDEDFITVDTGIGAYKKYSLGIIENGYAVDAVFVISNWNDSGEALLLYSDYSED